MKFVYQALRCLEFRVENGRPTCVDPTCEACYGSETVITETCAAREPWDGAYCMLPKEHEGMHMNFGSWR